MTSERGGLCRQRVKDEGGDQDKKMADRTLLVLSGVRMLC